MRLKLSQLSTEEKDLLEVWRDGFPRQAYASGLKEDAGRVYVPEPKREKALEALEERLVESEDESLRATAASLRASFHFREPFVPIESAVWAFQSHLALGGLQNPNLKALCKSIQKSFAAWAPHIGKDVPPYVAILTSWHASAFRDLVASVGAKASPGLKTLLEGALAAMEAYVKPFNLPRSDGSFEQTFPLLQDGEHFGRTQTYAQLVGDLYSYSDGPAEIEAQGAKFLRAELPRFREITEELARAYECEADPRVVKREMGRVRNGVGSVLEFTQSLRAPLREVMQKRLVGITEAYFTSVLETPDYLETVYPTTGASSFAQFAEKPFNYYFITTDDRRAPPTGVPEYYQTLVHEEFGHCVNFSNSAAKFGRHKPSLAELLPSPLELPISDAYSFNLEWMSVDLLRELFALPKRSKAEEEVVKLLLRNAKPERVILENEFEMRYWRIIRFLRAIGDVRLNWRGESVLKFMAWGEKETGISKKTIFDQVFTFQDTPGYAPCYAIAGDRFKRLLARAESNGATRKAFNTYVSSMGFVPERVFERRLRDQFAS